MTSTGLSWFQRPNLFEVVLIVASVLLALSFDEVREDWDRRERADAWALAFEQEVCGNAALIQASLDERRVHLERLESDPGYDFAQPFPSIRNASWEVLRNSDVMRALPPELIDLAARLYAAQSQYRATQPQFYLSANLRRVAQSVSERPIPRAVFADAYRGFLVLETEMIELYEEVQDQLGIRCSDAPAPVAAGSD